MYLQMLGVVGKGVPTQHGQPLGMWVPTQFPLKLLGISGIRVPTQHLLSRTVRTLSIGVPTQHTL